MGVILSNNNLGYKSFVANLNFYNSDVPTSYSILKNEIGFVSFNSTGLGGQFYVTLDNNFAEFSTFIPNIIAQDGSNPITHIANITWDFNFSPGTQLLFNITDKNGNLINNITAYRVALEIRIYNQYTNY